MIKLFMAVMVALCMLTSCVSVKAEQDGPKKAQMSNEDMKKINFKKVENVNVELELVSHLREFKAGKPVKLTFRLRNYSLKPLVVYEWMMKESDNLRLYYVPWKANMRKPPKKDWIPLIPNFEKNIKRVTLELAHRNFVLIDKKLPFIKDMETKAPQIFVVYAELNLTSISAKSRLIKITVKP
jgi:hypothetical protein